MVKLKGDKEIGDKINKIVGRLAEANGLKDVMKEADFNDESKLGGGKDMVDKLSKLVAIFEGLDFGANRSEGDDLLGDAYEYLMRHFATESGKSKGQFYTPAEVSRVMAKVVGIGQKTQQNQTIYDPTCGSGSLLLKAVDEAPRGMTIYGQEMDNATWSLARMNMILHAQPTADLQRGNTLASPLFKNANNTLKTFDFAVANPPFSSKAWSSGLDPVHDEFKRFEYGIPPAKNGDYAFLLHLITSLKSKGKGAIILPHGVLFRGNKEADIRKNLIMRGLIKGIIGLPANLFYGTGIPACIVVIDKENAHARTGIFMIDASRGCIKDGNKNRLRAQDIHKIVDVFNKQIETPRYSRMVPVAEIASEANDYNLNIPRYIDSSESEDLHDLDAHLRGGIPNRDVDGDDRHEPPIDGLRRYWTVFPSLRKVLFKNNGRKGYCEPRVEVHRIKATILAHDEYKTYAAQVAGLFDQWRQAHEPSLKRIKAGSKPKQLIDTLSEDMLERFADVPLLSRYDAYQRLMDYWADVMQDDVYLIAAEGWIEAAKPRDVIDDKEKKIKETPDLVVGRKKYKMDLLPPPLIVARYFADQQTEIDALQAKQEEAARQLEEFIEEHTGEEGLLEEATNDKGNVTKGGVNARLKAIENEPEGDEERHALERCQELMDAESDASKAVKDARTKLDKQVLEKYPKLTEAEIKTLVVEDKWIASLRIAIDGEFQRLTQRLAGRVKELEERYAETLPSLEAQVNQGGRTLGTNGAGMEMSATTTERNLRLKADSSSGIPRGYKRTEAGMIPEDWDLCSLEQITDPKCPICYGIVQVGFHVEDGIPVLAIKNLNNDYHSDVHHCLSNIEAPYARSRVRPDDVLISVKGTTGRVGIVPRSFQGNISRDLARVRVNNENVPEFVKQMLQSHTGQHKLELATVGTTRLELSIGVLKQVQIPCAPKNEQRTVAEALSDVDTLIGALDKLIAKKRAVKLATMQQLLTGKKRLLGFEKKRGNRVTNLRFLPMDWNMERIDAHASIRTGAKNTQDRTDDGKYPFFVRSQEVERINSYSYDGEAVLTAGDGVGTGKVFHYINGRFDVHQRVYRISDFSNRLNGRYFFYQFCTRFYDRIMSMTAKSSVDSVRMEMIAGMEIALPSLEEQRAIATVLSDMDAEIAALERRRDKTKSIKQGMMQQLLTGRIRLLKP